MKTTTNAKHSPETLRMAAEARMVRDLGQSGIDSRGKRLPLRYWVALAAVEADSAE